MVEKFFGALFFLINLGWYYFEILNFKINSMKKKSLIYKFKKTRGKCPPRKGRLAYAYNFL